MSARDAQGTLQEFLSIIELEEAKLLTWGVVDGGFSEEELEDLARAFLASRSCDLTHRELIEALLEERLAFAFEAGGYAVYRSRMAEGIRLFARLRQILWGRDWRGAPTLVSDFRFMLRRRTYPKRDIALADAVGEWSREGVLRPHRQQAIEALFNDRQGFRLSGFQVRATSRLLRDVDGHWSRGMIVTVGTGSGKTLAFYMPALSHIATLTRAGDYWTKALALYPRNELLKDQFSEAYSEARRLDALLSQPGRRKLLIGAFFGPTPDTASVRAVERKKWARSGAGYICPFLRCPVCDGDLRWATEDIEAGRELLKCTDPGCDKQIPEDEVILTRNRMKSAPPDVLFTTTETLNRRMSDSYNRHIFGIGASRPPQLMLLDEVHTYSGTSGAQVALLLRRWRHAVGSRVQFTGLSATLRNASEFFATLCGLNPAAVEEVAPTRAEMESEGMEYMLALRGDPVSKASLLSTSIQAVMLLGRLMDPGDRSPSDGTFGRKVFVFTDDLDVTNRFFHNLLDAEGWDGRGRRQIKVPLAAFRARSPEGSEERQRWDPRRAAAGQLWRVAEDIGHPMGLRQGLRIGRTSSQDVGVDSQSDVIVATASLEVGFNDPHVGAVLQHKAPRDAAAFLQRKGRAGRSRTMRPWTVVVLSDYGRDRLAYQGYDALFDPTLEPRTLPIANRYVLRMQAVFALMDWIARQLPPALPKGSVFDDWSGPSNGNHPAAVVRRTRQGKEATLLRQLLSGDEGRLVSLRRHLRDALQVSDDEVEALLWEPPRALVTAVTPTLLRRLESNWRRVPLHEGETPQDLLAPNSPLPDFVPQSLFSDLNLPEVTVYTEGTRPGAEREDTLPITQALRTLAPGAVTRRFAVTDARASHWIAPLSLEDERQEMPVEGLCESFEEVGTFQTFESGQVIDVRCIRPWTMRPSVPKARVLTTSNAQLDWRTQIIPSGDGVTFEIAAGSPWRGLLREMTFHVHNYRSHVEVRRFAIGSCASIRFNSGRELSAEIQFTDLQTCRRAAVGYAEFVDGMVFRCRLPDELLLHEDDSSDTTLRGLRTAYFRDSVRRDDRLKEYANTFQLDWLQQIYLSTLTAWAIAEATSLEYANAALRPGIVERGMAKVLDAIFQTLQVEEDGDGTETTDDAGERRQRVHNELLALCANVTVTERLSYLAHVLWEPGDQDFRAWVALRLKATIGGALLSACRELYPEASSDDLLLDLDPGPRLRGAPVSSADEIWITETTIGGGGVVEEILRRFAEDPRRFFRLAESALGASDFEVVDAELTRILRLLQTDKPLAETFVAVRASHDHQTLQASVQANRAALQDRGVQVSHAVMTALYARVLRPASDQGTDALLHGLVERWLQEETRLGIEIDARVFAYLESAHADLDSVLTRLDPAAEATPQWRFHVLSGLLWPRGHAIRSQALASYNPFQPLPETDRLLLLDLLESGDEGISLSDPNWRSLVEESLRRGGAARLIASASEAEALKRVLLDLASTPVELGFLQFFPQVEGIARGPNGYVARLYLPESVQ